jgi:hypothetical protein
VGAVTAGRQAPQSALHHARLHAPAFEAPPCTIAPLARLQTGIHVLGVVENMSGLRQPMSSFQFFGPGGEDITTAVLAAAGAVAGAGSSGSGGDGSSSSSGIWAETSVFHASGGGAQAMAADMQVGGNMGDQGGLGGWVAAAVLGANHLSELGRVVVKCRSCCRRRHLAV